MLCDIRGLDIFAKCKPVDGNQATKQSFVCYMAEQQVVNLIWLVEDAEGKPANYGPKWPKFRGLISYAFIFENNFAVQTVVFGVIVQIKIPLMSSWIKLR